MSPVGAMSQGRVEEKIRKGFRQEVTLCRHSSLQKTTSWEKMCSAQFFNIFSNIKEEKKKDGGRMVSKLAWYLGNTATSKAFGTPGNWENYWSCLFCLSI